MGDRPFAFVRTPGPKGFPWHSGREQEELVLFRPHFREGGAATLPPDIEETFVGGLPDGHRKCLRLIRTR
jgi:hypothetical protein